MPLTVVQALPALDVGGVERGTLEVAAELVRRGHRSIVISAGGRLVDKLISEGSEHFTMPIGNKSPMTLLEIRRLRSLLESESASILHARSRLPAWIAYLAWRKMSGRSRCGFVTTVHGPYSVNRYSRIMMHGQRIIAISSFIRDYILKNYPDTDESRIRVIHRGVATNDFPRGYQPAENWQIKWRSEYPDFFKDRFIVTLPARITRWKGQEDFIQVIRLAAQEGIPVHGFIAGGPHPRRYRFYQQLQGQVQKLDLDSRITFLGHRNDLREIMSVSDVVCSLAREPEAFGRTALEALCLGTPVIAYNHGGASEVLAEMFPVGLVEPMNHAAAARKLVDFYRRRPGVTAENPFTLEKMLNKTISVYEELNAESGRDRNGAGA